MKEPVRRVAGDVDDQWWAEYQIGDDWMVAELLHKSESGLVAKELRIFPMQAVCRIGGRSGAPATTFAPRQPGTADWDTCGMPKGGITARLLRQVKSQRLEAIRTWMDQMTPLADVNLQSVLGPTATTAPKKKGGARRPPRRGSTVRFYAQIAVDYTRLIDCRERRPTRELARLRGIPPAVAKRYVHRARELGFLTRSADQHGRSGGRATEAALRAVAAVPAAKIKNGS